MNIELTMNGKKLISPNYTLLRNDNFTSLTFAINTNNSIDYSFAHNDFHEHYVTFWYKNKTFFFETKENIYMFDLGEDVYKIPLKTKVGVSVSNVDSNGLPIYKKVKHIVFSISKY